MFAIPMTPSTRARLASPKGHSSTVTTSIGLVSSGLGLATAGVLLRLLSALVDSPDGFDQCGGAPDAVVLAGLFFPCSGEGDEGCSDLALGEEDEWDPVGVVDEVVDSDGDAVVGDVGVGGSGV